MVWVFIGFALVGNAPSIWKWYRKHRAMGAWITTTARIDLATFSPISGLKQFLTSQKKQAFTAVLGYNYVVEGDHYHGQLERSFESEEEAAEFVRELEGRSVSIRLNPTKPSDSILPDEEVENLLESRPPNLEAQRAISSARQVPRWVKPLLWPFVMIAAVGLILSISVHVAALLGRQLLPMPFFVVLHLGIFVVWIPTVFVARKTQRGSSWNSMFRNAHGWMSGMTAFFFVYAGINFAIFFSQVQGHPHDLSGPAKWRGFSGHWMVFYSAALSVLYSAVVAQEDESLKANPWGQGGRP